MFHSSSSSEDEFLSSWGVQAAPASAWGSVSREHNSDSSTESSEEEFSETEASEEGGGRGDRADLPQPSTRETYDLFRQFADRHTGTLSFEDIKGAVQELWPQFDHEPPLRRAYDAADRDANGSIGRREFQLLLSNIVHFDSLWKVFDTVEVGNTAPRMTREKFQEACAAVHLQISENAAEEFEACVKAEGSSETHLGFDHFCDWMLKQKRQAHLTGTQRTTKKRRKPAPPARKPKLQPTVTTAAGIASQRPQQDSDTESDVDEEASSARREPEPEPVYDSDSSGSELSDDDAAVALLARIQNSPFRGSDSPVPHETPAKSETTSSAQERLSQLLDELGSPPPGRGAAGLRSASSKAVRATPSGFRTATSRTLATATPESERMGGASGVASNSDLQSTSIHHRLYSHKTAATSADLLKRVNLAKHGLSKEAMDRKVQAAKIKADMRAEQRAMDEAQYRQERLRAAADRRNAQEERVRMMRMAAMADKKRADELKQRKKKEKDEEIATIRRHKREALEQAREAKRVEKVQEEELLRERREERERQDAIDAAIEEERRQERRREMLSRRETAFEMRRQKHAVESTAPEYLFESRVNDTMAAELELEQAKKDRDNWKSAISKNRTSPYADIRSSGYGQRSRTRTVETPARGSPHSVATATGSRRRSQPARTTATEADAKRVSDAAAERPRTPTSELSGSETEDDASD